MRELEADGPTGAWLEEFMTAALDGGGRAATARPAEPPRPTGLALGPAADSPNRGLLSAVRAGRRLLLVQTEVVEGPIPLVRSLVLANGTALLKRQCTAEGRSAEDTARIVREEHRKLENELRGRLVRLANAKTRARRDACYRLFELGLEAYCRGAYEAALAHWRRARELSSDEASLAFSIRAAEARLVPEGRR
jgi:hypothetical protein